MYFNDDNNGNL